jgi:tetrahydromethanopterin S-methyltransferase subunit F
VGFGFIGLIFGSFIGWCAGLISRMKDQALLEYMMFGGLIGIAIGIITSFVLTKTTFASRRSS